MKRYLISLFATLWIATLTTSSIFGQNFTSRATIDQDFCGSSVIVVMDHNRGGMNRVHPHGGGDNTATFGAFELSYITDLTYIPIEVTADRPRGIPPMLNEETFRQILLLRLEKDCKQNVLDVIEQLRFTPGIYFAEPNYFVELMDRRQPNDPFLNQLWGMEMIQAPEAWAIAIGSREIRVAAIDIGFEAHNDLNANIDFSVAWCFNSNQAFSLANLGHTLPSPPSQVGWHGNHVIGTIGAVGNNALGVVGVNWEVSLVPFEVFVGFNANNQPVGSGANQALALTRAIQHNIPVVNMSMSGFEALRIQIRDNFRGVFVAAAGNSATNLDNIFGPGQPVPPNAFLVGAHNRQSDRASFSCFGANAVQIWAPGTEILSTTLNHAFQQSQGTSMAAPHVAGVAALLFSMVPTLTAQEVKTIIMESAVPITINTPAGQQSARRLNAFNAVSAVMSMVVEPPTNLQYHIERNTVTLTWDAPVNEPDAPQLIGFNVFRDNVLLNTTPVPHNVLTFREYDVPANRWTYTVRAIHVEGIQSAAALVTLDVNYPPMHIISLSPDVNASNVQSMDPIIIAFDKDFTIIDLDAIQSYPEINSPIVLPLGASSLMIMHGGFELGSRYTITIPSGTFAALPRFEWSFTTFGYETSIQLSEEPVAVTILPNPVEDILYLETAETVRTIEIFNQQGRLVLSAEGNMQSVDVNALPSGAYVIRITTDSGVSTQRFVKR